MTTLGLFSSFPLEFGGGGEATALYLANWLGSNGFEVTFSYDSSRQVQRRIDADSVQPQILHFAYRGERFRPFAPTPVDLPYRSLPAISSFQRSDLNVVFLDRVPPPRFLLAVRDAGCRVLFLLHGLAIERPLPPHPSAAAYELFLRPAMRTFRILAEAKHAHFQVLTEVMADEVANCRIPQERVHLIPSGIPIESIPEPTQHETFGVAFMARMVAATKGTDFLAQVLGRLKRQIPGDMQVAIMGSGPDSGPLSAYKAPGPIRYLGFVSDPVKRETLAASDLLLVTSYIEPFSLATVEGLAAGLRVLTTPASGPKSIVARDSGFGETLPYNPQVFADAIIGEYRRWNTASDRLRGERITRRRRCAALFSAEAMARHYSAVLERMT